MKRFQDDFKFGIVPGCVSPQRSHDKGAVAADLNLSVPFSLKKKKTSRHFLQQRRTFQREHSPPLQRRDWFSIIQTHCLPQNGHKWLLSLGLKTFTLQMILCVRNGRNSMWQTGGACTADFKLSSYLSYR